MGPSHRKGAAEGEVRPFFEKQGESVDEGGTTDFQHQLHKGWVMAFLMIKRKGASPIIFPARLDRRATRWRGGAMRNNRLEVYEIIHQQ